ncbi:SurA N-terminal domain-containing protein [Isoptericola sediminis]|uniref:peptidylprolyl isomerase n=1 Tax=Isoptericola sediminis TaxID=2733572 RepID=A0A849K1Y2_9MICO|nr:SurA N-terminal domain-containing protein [Isoptericola sediminis]NNU27208.1 SurA [Isoptericola sediminis]
MSIKRPLAAVTLAAVVALAGCSAGSDGDDTSSAPASPSAEAAPDAGAAPEADLEDVPDVVAEVNGEEIGREEFVTSFEGQLQQAALSQQQSGAGEVDQDALKKQVVEQLVNNRLLTQAAADAGIEPTAKDVRATLEDVAAQNGLESADAVISALKEQGLTEEQVRADAATQFQVSTYIEQEADVQEPSEKELRAQYDELVAQMESQGGDGASAPEIPPFEDVRDQLAQQATSQQQSAAIDTIVTDLREDADVTINL